MITEDGPLPKCSLCGLRTRDLQKHQRSRTCQQAQRKRMNEKKQDKQYNAGKVQFTVNGKQLQRVKQFRYLGRIFTDNDDDSICIQENLRSARSRWNSIAKILKNEGANAKVMAKFYITIVQAVLLYGADTWVVTKRDMTRLNSFHKRVVRYLTGKHIRKHDEANWEYPDHDSLLKECGLLPLEVYIERRRGTLRKYLEEYRADLLDETKRIKKHCKDANKILWWQQPWKLKSELNNFSNFWFK